MYIESLEKGEGLEHMPLALQSKFIIKIEGNGKMIFFMNDSKKVGSYSMKSSSKIIGNLGGRFSMTLDGEALRMIPLGQLDLETGFPIIFSRTSSLVSVVHPEEPYTETKPLESVTVSPNLRYDIKDGMVTITGCVEKVSGELTVPATIEGKPVTSIGERAFFNFTFLTSITIPDSVTSIGDSFSLCSYLTAVIFLGDAPKVGNDGFLGATPTIYRKPEAKGWGDTWGGRPVKLISEKP